jgi:hypothetical protein
MTPASGPPDCLLATSLSSTCCSHTLRGVASGKLRLVMPAEWWAAGVEGRGGHQSIMHVRTHAYYMVRT